MAKGKRSVPDRKIGPEQRKVIKRAEEQGWSIEVTQNGHLRFRSPTGEIVHVPSRSAAKNKGGKNALGLLRRAGLDV